MISNIKNTISTLKKLDKKYIIIYYLVELIRMYIAVEYSIELGSLFYKSLVDQQYLIAIQLLFKIKLLSMVITLLTYNSLIVPCIERDVTKIITGEYITLVDKTKNIFLELSSDIAIGSVIDYKKTQIMKLLIEYPTMLSMITTKFTSIIILLQNNYKITILYFLFVIIKNVFLYKLNIKKYTDDHQNYDKLGFNDLLLSSINRKIINHSQISGYNDIDNVKKYMILQLNHINKINKFEILYKLIDLVIPIIEFGFYKIIDYQFMLMWYIHYNSIESFAVSCTQYLPLHMNDYMIKRIHNINKSLKLIDEIGLKKDLIKIPYHFQLLVKPCDINIEKVQYMIKDEIIITPGKTILLDGKSGMGKTFLYKIMIGLIDVQPIVYLNSKKLLLGFEHLCGQIKCLSPLTDKTLYDYILSNKTIKENVGVYRTDGSVENAIKMCCLTNKFSIDTKIDHLSNGEEHRILLAKVLPLDETDNIPVLILDEPDNGVDYETGLKIINNIITWFHKKHHGCVFLTTHQKAIKNILKFDAIYEADNMIIKRIK